MPCGSQFNRNLVSGGGPPPMAMGVFMGGIPPINRQDKLESIFWFSKFCGPLYGSTRVGGRTPSQKPDF